MLAGYSDSEQGAPHQALPKLTIDEHACNGCGECVAACLRQMHQRPSGAQEHLSRVQVLGQGQFYGLAICRQCAQAPCVDACISGALVANPVQGQIDVREPVCIGCGMCVMVCPFGAIWLDEEKGKAAKCDACPTVEQPACAAACPTGALTTGLPNLTGSRRRATTRIKLTPDHQVALGLGERPRQ